MKTLIKQFDNLLQDESGQGLVEYALIAGLIAVAAVVGMTSLGSKLGTAFQNLSTRITNISY